jgi:hypothetical protein
VAPTSARASSSALARAQPAGAASSPSPREPRSPSGSRKRRRDGCRLSRSPRASLSVSKRLQGRSARPKAWGRRRRHSPRPGCGQLTRLQPNSKRCSACSPSTSNLEGGAVKGRRVLTSVFATCVVAVSAAPSPCDGSTFCSSSSLGHAGCISPARRAGPPGRGWPSRAATWPSGAPIIPSRCASGPRSRREVQCRLRRGLPHRGGGRDQDAV